MLTQRSYQKELLDQDSIPFKDILLNMQELNFINTWLGGHAITSKGFAHLLNKRKSISVCEIGCGGGDNLIAIKKYCDKKNIKVQLIGIDIKQACIDVAKSNPLLKDDTVFICSDYLIAKFQSPPDIIFSSLFCHHFTEPQLKEQLVWMKNQSTVGFFINDLHRNWLAFILIKALTQLFSSSYLVKNDAPLSVKRGFLKKEWTQIGILAGIEELKISWEWAFRHLIVFKRINK
jgi:SAM-dependent methyltransferase